jgi:hypothetical protein
MVYLFILVILSLTSSGRRLYPAQAAFSKEGFGLFVISGTATLQLNICVRLLDFLCRGGNTVI